MFRTIYGTTNIVEGSIRATILIPKGIRLHIKNAFYFLKSNRNLLSFKDIYVNEYHIETNNDGDMEYLYMSKLGLNKKCALEKLLTFSYGL